MGGPGREASWSGTSTLKLGCCQFPSHRAGGGTHFPRRSTDAQPGPGQPCPGKSIEDRLARGRAPRLPPLPAMFFPWWAAAGCLRSCWCPTCTPGLATGGPDRVSPTRWLGALPPYLTAHCQGQALCWPAPRCRLVAHWLPTRAPVGRVASDVPGPGPDRPCPLGKSLCAQSLGRSQCLRAISARGGPADALMDAWAVFPDTSTRSRAAVHGPARQGKLLLALAPPRGPAGHRPANHRAQPLSPPVWRGCRAGSVMGAAQETPPQPRFLVCEVGRGLWSTRHRLRVSGKAGEVGCGGPDLGAEANSAPILVSTLCPPHREWECHRGVLGRWIVRPGPKGSWGCWGADGTGVGAAGGVACTGLGGGPWCSLSCLLSSLFLLLLPPPPPALLLPRVWPWAVPTYGPYGRFCSLSACLSCMSVLVPVTGTPLCLVLLCPVSSPRAPL